MTPSSYGPFDVDLSENQLQWLRDFHKKAIAAGIGVQFIADFKAVVQKLREAPREWGDPLRSLARLQLLIYRGIHQKICVTYGVQDQLPIVFVRTIDLILDHPLAGS